MALLASALGAMGGLLTVASSLRVQLRSRARVHNLTGADPDTDDGGRRQPVEWAYVNVDVGGGGALAYARLAVRWGTDRQTVLIGARTHTHPDSISSRLRLCISHVTTTY